MNKNIMLIVDDIELNRNLLEESFSKEYTIIHACNGKEALRQIEKYTNNISIILLDIVMPEMNGIDLLKWLSGTPYSTIPVIAITAESSYQLEAIKNGACDFISKPTDNEIIKARVNNVMSRYALKDAMKQNNILKKANVETDNLINSIPGGIAIYKVTDIFETIYFSDGVAGLSGYTREEYADFMQGDAANIIYEEDKSRVLNSAFNAMTNGKQIDETYRIYHKNGSLVWVRLNGVILGEENGAVILHAVFQLPPRMAQLYDNLVNESQNIIYVSDINNYDLLYINKSGLKTIDKENADYSCKKCYEFLFNYNSPCPFCKIDKMNADAYLERDFLYPVNNKIYSMRGKLTDWNGLSAHVEYIQDVTEIRKAEQNNADFTKQLQETFNNIPGGMCVYRVNRNGIVPMIHNQAFFDIFGYSSEHQKEILNQTNYLNVHPDDLNELQSIISYAIKNNGKINHTYRMFNDLKNCYIWINMDAIVVPQINGEKLCYVNYTNVDKIKKIEQELQENQLRYEVAIKSSGINIWEYDIVKDSLYVVSNSQRIKQNCFYIENYTKSTIDNGYVREDCITLFLSIFERLKHGEREITEDIWYKTTDEAGFWCERVTYTTTFDSTGKPIKAYGAGRDVTREKEAEKKFHEEVSYRKVMQSDNLATIIIDLTDNKVLDITSSFKSIKSLAGCTADEYFIETSKMVAGDQFVKKFNKIYNRNTLLSRFGSGDFVVPMELTRLHDTDKVYWINYSVHLIQNPATKNIVAHISCVDITHEKVMQTIMDTISKTDYDFFVVVDGSTDSGKDYAVAHGRLLYDEHKSFETQNEKWIRSCVCSDDLDRVINECKIETAWSHIKNGKPYKFSFSMKMPNGEIRRKQIQFTAISPDRKTYLMSRIDVNNIYLEQEVAKNKLQNALTAKSNFLSNMSHDMRTPMNAIIGFSEMSLDDNSYSKDELRDYLQKINHSGHYLLNLINNILDMAKIENNKISLHLEPVDSEKLLGGIISSVKPLMDEKNIKFVFETRNFINGKEAITDQLRMQQIFINLLSNAAKFTPPHGKVECIIEGVDFDGRYSKERVTIRDNGCGMSKEFLKNAFLPFEQEDSDGKTEHTGTGLGLAIVKNLVEIMGGTININSTKGVGTEVIMDFKTELVDKKSTNIKKAGYDSQEFIFNGKRILLCEDHPLNCEIASRLLVKKAFLVEIANDGSKGLEMFSNAPENYYDAVLMDIRMPVMDGFQTTQAIRALDRGDAKFVPIIAMTANAFDDDVKKSIDNGMNAHLAKPIEPKKLYDTLFELLSCNEQ